MVAGLIFLALLFLGQSVVSLPFTIYDTFVIEQKFGFNRVTPATFVMDRIKGLVLAAVIGVPLGGAVLWIFGNVGHAWLWAWALVTVFQLILVVSKTTRLLDPSLLEAAQESSTCGKARLLQRLPAASNRSQGQPAQIASGLWMSYNRRRLRAPHRSVPQL